MDQHLCLLTIFEQVLLTHSMNTRVSLVNLPCWWVETNGVYLSSVIYGSLFLSFEACRRDGYIRHSRLRGCRLTKPLRHLYPIRKLPLGSSRYDIRIADSRNDPLWPWVIIYPYRCGIKSCHFSDLYLTSTHKCQSQNPSYHLTIYPTSVKMQLWAYLLPVATIGQVAMAYSSK